jgi:hypothetical protein
MARRVSVLALALIVSEVQAQSYWNDDRERLVARLEFLRPFIEHTDLKALTGAGFFSLSGRIGASMRLEAELPLAAGGERGGPSASLIGNPYLGLRFQKSGRTVGAQLGVRLPVHGELSSSEGEFAVAAAAVSDPDRLEAFFEHTVTARFAVEVRPATSGNFLAGVKVGASAFFPTEAGDTEVFLDYGGRIGLQSAAVRAALALTGRLFATADGGSLADRTFHHVTATVDLVGGRIRPGALLRVPLDESSVNAVLGVQLTVVP